MTAPDQNPFDTPLEVLFDHLPAATAPRSPERARLERREARRQSLIDHPPNVAAYHLTVLLFDQRRTVSPINESLNDPACARWFRALKRAGLVRKVTRYEWCGAREYWIATRSA